MSDTNRTPIPVEITVDVLARLLAWDIEKEEREGSGWTEPLTGPEAVSHVETLLADWAEGKARWDDNELVDRLERRLLEIVVYGYSVGLEGGAPPMGMIPTRAYADSFAADLAKLHPRAVVIVTAYQKDGTVLFEDRMEPVPSEEEKTV